MNNTMNNNNTNNTNKVCNITLRLTKYWGGYKPGEIFNGYVKRIGYDRNASLNTVRIDGMVLSDHPILDFLRGSLIPESNKGQWDRFEIISIG